MCVFVSVCVINRPSCQHPWRHATCHSVRFHGSICHCAGASKQNVSLKTVRTPKREILAGLSATLPPCKGWWPQGRWKENAPKLSKNKRKLDCKQWAAGYAQRVDDLEVNRKCQFGYEPKQPKNKRKNKDTKKKKIQYSAPVSWVNIHKAAAPEHVSKQEGSS